MGAWGPPPPPPNAVAECGGPKTFHAPRLKCPPLHAGGAPSPLPKPNLGAWPSWALRGPPQAPGVAANTPNFFQPPTSGQRARTPTQGGGLAPLAAGAPGKQRPPGGHRPNFAAALSKTASPSPRGGRKRPCCLLQGRAPTQKNGRGPPPWGGARPGGAQQLQIWATIVQTPSPRGGSKGGHRFGLVGTAHLVPVCAHLLAGKRPGGPSGTVWANLAPRGPQLPPIRAPSPQKINPKPPGWQQIPWVDPKRPAPAMPKIKTVFVTVPITLVGFYIKFDRISYENGLNSKIVKKK